MSAELNLTDEQKRRIESAETPQEKAAIISEAVDIPRELPDDALDAVSGGYGEYKPRSMEEVEATCKLLKSIVDNYGGDAAAEWLDINGYASVSGTSLASGNGIATLYRVWSETLEQGWSTYSQNA